MIFAPDLAEKILTGKKTVTRRPRSQHNTPCRYQKGRTYAVQPGRGKKGIGHIRVMSVRAEWLSDMDNGEARDEGFRNLREFADRWVSLYEKAKWTDPVWRIEFRLADTTPEPVRVEATPDV